MFRFSLLCAVLYGAFTISGHAIDFDATTAQWDWIDMKGDAQIHTVEALNPPPGYGPEVLELDGDLILGLLKDERLDTGDILVLYRELEARDKDADGILLFHAAYGDNVSVEHNTKVKRTQSWLELDNDSGMHFRAIGEDGEERAFDEHPGLMLVTDNWNITGWIWQRVHITEDRAMGRVWPAHEAEPVDWHLDTERFGGDGRRFGLRVSSGAVQVAHFEAGEEEIARVEELKPWIFFPKETLISPARIPLHLFNPNSNRELVGETVSIQWDSGTMSEKLMSNKDSNQSPATPYFIPLTYPQGNSGVERPTGLTQIQVNSTKGKVEIVYNDTLQTAISEQRNKLKMNGILNYPNPTQQVHRNSILGFLEKAGKALQDGDAVLAQERLDQAIEAEDLSNSVEGTLKIDRTGAPYIFKRWMTKSPVTTDFFTHIQLFPVGLYKWIELEHPNGEKNRLEITDPEPNQGFVLAIPPTMGYYTLRWEREGEVHEQKIVGPVVETKDSQLYVNGEPFIVKGVNVHALDSGNPERTRRMMKSLKGLGFNLLRGDYPPTWEVEMGEEENLFWTILAPFSVASTDEIQERQGGSLMGEAREIAMEHILKYRDYSGTLLWNSCNEITGDTTAFLENLYPVYKHLDPYSRPVHYANLFGQERWQGQDAVGINYYFAKGQTPEDKHPLILKSIDLAKAQNKPVFYTEYNSYQGPDPQGGVMAMEGLFEWGVEQGMSGGFLYMAPTSSDHPGVWVDGELNTDSRMAAAFHKAFDDVAVLISVEDSSIQISNKRPYALRNVDIFIDDTLHSQIKHIPAFENRAVPDLKPDDLRGELSLSMESHYGIHTTIRPQPDSYNVTLTQEQIELLEASVYK